MAPRGVGTQGCKKLRFFKIVFGDDNSKAMYFPPTIAQKVQHLAGQETEIVDTSGARWPVTVSEINGSLAFQRGWQKFYSDHSLRKGEVLVFKYIWGRHFTVRVFGLSACDRLNFNNEMPRKSKRARRDPGPVIEEDQFQTININSGDKPVSEVGRSPVPMEVEVLEYMMKKEDECYQREDRTIWGDLSVFEQNILLLPSTSGSQNISKSHIGISDQAKTIGDDVQMDEVDICQVEGHSGNVVSNTFKKAVETKPVPFHHDIIKQALEKGCDTQTAAINSRENDIRHLKKPSEISNSRKGMESFSGSPQTAASKSSQTGFKHLKKPSDSGNSGFQFLSSPVAKEPSVKSAMKSEMMEMEGEARAFPQATCAAIHSSQTDIKHLEKPFESGNSRKGMLHIFNAQNESFSGSSQTAANKSSQTGFKHLKKPSDSGNSRKGMIDSSNAQSSIFQFLSSLVAKEPSVKSAIKSEMMEMEDEARPFPQASCGKEPTVVDNHEQMKVKAEPQSYDDNPPPVAFTFSAEVKNNVYLELPVELKSRQKGKRKSCKVVLLKDSNERMWPLLCPEKSGVTALCLNWTNFCRENNIKPGDICRFQSESEAPYIFRVDVVPKSD